MELTLAAAAAAVCVLSLAAGLAARRFVSARPAGAMPALDAMTARWRTLTVATVRPDRVFAGLTVWLMILDSALALAAPWPLQFVVDYGIGHHPLPAWLADLRGLPTVVLASVAAMAGLLLLGAAAMAGYLTTYLAGVLSERMTLRLRSGLFWHVLRAAPASVGRYPLGELTSRIGPDVRQLSDTIGSVIQTLIPDLTLLAGMAAVMAWLDWRLAVVAACVLPGYAFTARVRNRALRPAQRQARARSGELAALAADQLGRLPAIHVFDQAAAEHRRHIKAAARSADAAVAALDASARYRPVVEMLPGLALAAALIAGTTEVAAGRLTVGGLLVFLAYLSSLTGPVQSLTTMSTTIARGSASRDRVKDLLRLPALESASRAVVAGRHRVAADSGPTLVVTQRRGAHARLDRVTFGYGDSSPVLDRVSLDLRPDQVTCLSGPSGAGKSSLLALLIRLAEPQSGHIVIDGQDIADLPLARLRQLVTLVPQEPWLHTGTIGENIRYGNPSATRAEVMTSARRAGVSTFAERLPNGYDFEVGEHGAQLSGGQRRRVAVARALLRDTPLLLLDEPTTGLDPAAEAALITGLLAATVGKAVLLVTHQPRLVDLADQVMRLDGGRLAIARSDARLEQQTSRYQRFQWTTSSNGRRLGLTSGLSGRSAG